MFFWGVTMRLQRPMPTVFTVELFLAMTFEKNQQTFGKTVCDTYHVTA